ncbi:ZWICHEL kinesin-like calmodulin-binding protein, partial [Prunus dulcis]
FSLSLSLSLSCETRPFFFIFGLLRPHLHASTTATTRRHLGRHRSVGTTTLPTFHSTQPPPRSAAVTPESATKGSGLDRFLSNFRPSFSLISPPNWTSKVLRPRIRSRRDPLRVRQCGLLVEFLGKCSIYRGDSAKIFGRKSRFLVSGPGIGEMSVTRQDSLRFSRIPGQVLSPTARVLTVEAYISLCSCFD